MKLVDIQPWAIAARMGSASIRFSDVYPCLILDNRLWRANRLAGRHDLARDGGRDGAGIPALVHIVADEDAGAVARARAVLEAARDPLRALVARDGLAAVLLAGTRHVSRVLDNATTALARDQFLLHIDIVRLPMLVPDCQAEIARREAARAERTARIARSVADMQARREADAAAWDGNRATAAAIGKFLGTDVASSPSGVGLTTEQARQVLGLLRIGPLAGQDG